MSSTEQRLIDWTSAGSEAGTLTVSLTGSPPKGWAKHFDAVLALLDHGAGRWGKIKLRKGMIEVADVREGAEPELRHLLESVVLQVNADLELQPVEQGAEEGDEDERQVQADRRATATFRSFAG